MAIHFYDIHGETSPTHHKLSGSKTMCYDFLSLNRNFLPSVSQISGVVQRASASHVPLVHVGSVLQQELTSYQRTLKENDRKHFLF